MDFRSVSRGFQCVSMHFNEFLGVSEGFKGVLGYSTGYQVSAMWVLGGISVVYQGVLMPFKALQDVSEGFRGI